MMCWLACTGIPAATQALCAFSVGQDVLMSNARPRPNASPTKPMTSIHQLRKWLPLPGKTLLQRQGRRMALPTSQNLMVRPRHKRQVPRQLFRRHRRRPTSHRLRRKLCQKSNVRKLPNSRSFYLETPM